MKRSTQQMLFIAAIVWLVTRKTGSPAAGVSASASGSTTTPPSATDLPTPPVPSL